jgi:hypothetical protein
MADQISEIDAVRRGAGQEILDLTDQFGFGAFAAAWLHDRGTGAWRYLLVTPMLKTRGPRWVYERLLRLFRHNPLPTGITPLDIYVVDPDMEIAAFGEPVVAMDDRAAPAGLSAIIVQDIKIEDFLIGNGFAAFYRRLPLELRKHQANPARQFDLRIRQLDKAA